MRFAILAVTALFFLSGCSSVQYASHLIKKALPGDSESGAREMASISTAAGKSMGNFKVGKPYKVEGRWYYPREEYDLTETGIASWYGPGFHGKSTANGERFDSGELTAAHRTLQMPSLVRVTNLENGKSVVVRVNDRGPYKRGRVMDVSERAAELLGFKGRGTAKVRLQVLKEESMRIAQAARSGADTRGYEMAMNEGRQRIAAHETPEVSPYYQTASYEPASYQPDPFETASYQQISGAGPVAREAIGAPPAGEPVPLYAGNAPQAAVPPGHMRGGAFYPDPVVTSYPVTPTNIYVQAGSFGVYDNAVRQRDRVAAFASAAVQETVVGGRPFYRVRLGPVSSVGDADALLSRLAGDGVTDAIIVVE